ncbi:OLC1v1005658C1 [Oldenlandia corymbosa var. corymbosa]|uniref:OLC1v1005658C1 n=1 Tax=Oldenlandia corymbosa var. corymbosa TaxID=529605 RepID=A0AAV1DFS9_OLDCO|nr:OLC1v1005658C1 [Oldenlandia corymbosa var. corymbosa]
MTQQRFKALEHQLASYATMTARLEQALHAASQQNAGLDADNSGCNGLTLTEAQHMVTATGNDVIRNMHLLNQFQQQNTVSQVPTFHTQFQEGPAMIPPIIGQKNVPRIEQGAQGNQGIFPQEHRLMVVPMETHPPGCKSQPTTWTATKASWSKGWSYRVDLGNEFRQEQDATIYANQNEARDHRLFVWQHIGPPASQRTATSRVVKTPTVNDESWHHVVHPKFPSQTPTGPKMTRTQKRRWQRVLNKRSRENSEKEDKSVAPMGNTKEDMSLVVFAGAIIFESYGSRKAQRSSYYARSGFIYNGTI